MQSVKEQDEGNDEQIRSATDITYNCFNIRGPDAPGSTNNVYTALAVAYACRSLSPMHLHDSCGPIACAPLTSTVDICCTSLIQACGRSRLQSHSYSNHTSS